MSGISSWYDYYRANGGVVAPGTFQGEDTDVPSPSMCTRAPTGRSAARPEPAWARPGPGDW
ncbi:hypothetical protein [Streptomyces sp. KL116D]|uniref:hypothetical protein n=1 Tax=Streptomyces sp. KL116D TaxID=3045152 RepID=UPI0035592711